MSMGHVFIAHLHCSSIYLRTIGHWLYGATVARLTPDQKVGSSNLSAVICNLLPVGAL